MIYELERVITNALDLGKFHKEVQWVHKKRKTDFSRQVSDELVGLTFQAMTLEGETIEIEVKRCPKQTT